MVTRDFDVNYARKNEVIWQVKEYVKKNPYCVIDIIYKAYNTDTVRSFTHFPCHAMYTMMQNMVRNNSVYKIKVRNK